MAVIFNWKKHKCGYFVAEFCIIPIKWKIPNVKYFVLTEDNQIKTSH